MRKFFVRIFLVALILVGPISSIAQSPSAEIDSIYLGNGVTLYVGAPRQLTLNAHIQNFGWAPDGGEIVYVSTVGENSVEASLHSVDLQNGQMRLYDEERAAVGNRKGRRAGTYIEHLGDWSPDGKFVYYVVVHESTDAKASTSVLKLLMPSRGVVQSVPVPSVKTGLQRVSNIHDEEWSPMGNLLAFQLERADGRRQTFVYDPSLKKAHDLFPSGPLVFLTGWADANRLIVSVRTANKSMRLFVDARTGQTSPAPRSARISFPPPRFLNAGRAGKFGLSPLDGGFSEGGSVDDITSRGKSHGAVGHLWISVVKEPYVSDAPPSLPPLLIDSFRLSSQEDRSNGIAALAVTRSGKFGAVQVAYSISGDLYVSTISARSATARELVEAGKPLTCPEERRLAEENEKQLGLAMIQYSQDYDGRYPPAAVFHDALYTYAHDEHLFNVGGQKFHYFLDADAAKDIAKPTETELGEFELPCGRVVLYADGHCEILKTDAKSERP